MTHEPECYLRDYELASCRQCDDLRRAYERGRKDEQDYHAECECHRMGTWFEKNGTVEWCSFDGVEFVPQSVALAEYQRGREDIIETVAQVMDDTPPHRRSLGVQDLMNRIEEALKDTDDDDE